MITGIVRREVACAMRSCHREGEQEDAKGASWAEMTLCCGKQEL